MLSIFHTTDNSNCELPREGGRKWVRERERERERDEQISQLQVIVCLLN